MMRRTQIKPGKGFARAMIKAIARAPIKPIVNCRGVISRADDRAPVVVEKDNCIEHEGYRRLVAALPCIRCGIAGFSQAAHPNVGKAKGTKADDRECFPLCCTRPLVVGCHYMFDQHQLFARGERATVEIEWGERTRAWILAAGTWPNNLPLWGTA